jgi:hypothetical protein
MTELEAVNIVLEAVHEAPVTSLSGVSATSVEGRAQTTLNTMSRKVQSEGFRFNTDYGVSITPVGNEILLPNVLSMIVDQYHTDMPPLTIRDGKLYDPTKQSFTFPGAVKFKKVVRYLPFNQLPFTAQNYIAERAATRFVERTLGAQALRAYSRESELTAHTEMINDRTVQERVDFLSGPEDSVGRYRF